MEAEIVGRAGLPFMAIHAGGVHGVGWRLPLNAWHLLRGLLEAAGLVRAFRPDALLVTGGFVTVPVALAAWLSRVPILVYLPDIEPGLAVRLIGRLARKIAVTAEDSRAYFRGRGQAARVVVTGYPTRPGLAGATRAEASAHFGLEAGRPTVLVTGGSRGARSINRAVWAALPDWLKDFQVVHLTGQQAWAEAEQARERLPEALRPRYHALAYLHEMGLALAAADLVVSRAGASALGEYPLFGLPAVLVPYPHAWRYQRVNADYLVRRGAAQRLDDEALAPELGPTVRRLLENPARLAEMRSAARAAATPGAAERIAQALKGLAAGRAAG
jgi:UDP-N-acetylglucosamine--N-acetylmuramyl-(pentapeptide) pyrophosphoryl-undecaprenol N-acetylglucosamine transferase